MCDNDRYTETEYLRERERERDRERERERKEKKKRSLAPTYVQIWYFHGTTDEKNAMLQNKLQSPTNVSTTDMTNTTHDQQTIP